jgi:uncharacterized protein YodC (DUF2158 family)
MEFTTGDVVQLASGGPKMTVQRIADRDPNYLFKTQDAVLKMSGFTGGDVVCQWFGDNGKVESDVFKPTMLIKV